MCSRFVEYALDNYKDVNDIIHNATNLRLINNFNAHWFASDKSGNSAIIEYINGNLVINYGQPLTIPSLTNHPYIYSCNQLQKYSFLGGKIKKLPQGHKSIERFVRGTYKLFNYDGSDPIQYMLKLMQSITRPTSTDSPTQWITIYDISNMKIYFMTRHEKKLQCLDFKKETEKANHYKIVVFE